MFSLTPVGPEPVAAKKRDAVKPLGGRMEGGVLDHSRLLHTTDSNKPVAYAWAAG